MTLIPDDFEVQDLDTIPIKKEEARHQAALVAALRRHWNQLPDGDRPVIFHIPMGGSRDAREAANLKTQGALAGVPDLCVVLPCSKTCWIEMKARGGMTSGAQHTLHRLFTTLGHDVIVAHSVFDALDQLRKRFNSCRM